MGHLQKSTVSLNAGFLKWTALTPGQPRHLPPDPPQDQHKDKIACFGRQSAVFLDGLPPAGADYEPRESITKKLRRLIQVHSWTAAFERAISTVSSQNLPELDRIRTLEQFYFLIDAMVTWIPELRIWEWHGTVYHERTDYLRITQFYYYFVQPDLLALQSPVDPHAGSSLSPLSLWLREYAIDYGKFLDTPASVGRLETYKYASEYAYQDFNGGEDGISGYRSFNDWFCRTFKQIDLQRPVAQPENPRIIAFPAESTFVGQWAIGSSEAEALTKPSSIIVKHVEWPIPTLLKDSAYAHDFEGGVMIQCFLNVNDYHRQHAPASGTILEARFIPGQVYMDVGLQACDPEERHPVGPANEVMSYPHLEALDPTGFQFLQCRGLFVLQTAIGKIAVLPVGMAQVSSVVFVKPGSDELIRLSQEEQRALSYEEQVDLLNARIQSEVVGKSVRKGDMMTSFLFGGSDLVMVFERQSKVNVTAMVGRHYPVRSQLATSSIEHLLV
ncbi:MAG: phosphatidylserine decarboxylase [Cyanobacteriota bacterium]|nr:phosphatidylserine decarboxylase [Cyanobacteriota bacterium]